MSNKLFAAFDGIETPRLLMRQLNIADKNDVYEFTALPETSKYLTWTPHQNINTTAAFIGGICNRYTEQQPAQWAVVLKSENKVIGINGFIKWHPEHQKAEVAYILSPHYWNQGLMSESLKAVIQYGFTTGNLHRIEAKCEVENTASERIMQKAGMVFEGVARDYLYIKNRYVSFKMYAILNR